MKTISLTVCVLATIVTSVTYYNFETKEYGFGDIEVPEVTPISWVPGILEEMKETNKEQTLLYGIPVIVISLLVYFFSKSRNNGLQDVITDSPQEDQNKEKVNMEKQLAKENINQSFANKKAQENITDKNQTLLEIFQDDDKLPFWKCLLLGVLSIAIGVGLVSLTNGESGPANSTALFFGGICIVSGILLIVLPNGKKK